MYYLTFLKSRLQKEIPDRLPTRNEKLNWSSKITEKRLKEKTNNNNVGKYSNTNDVENISNTDVDEVVADCFEDRQSVGEELVHNLVTVDKESKKFEEKSEELDRAGKSSAENDSLKERRKICNDVEVE